MSQQQIEMTVEEAECYDMFVMWKILHSPPALPGQIAPEDKAAMMTMLGWQSDYNRMQDSMREQKANAAANRGGGAPGKHTTKHTKTVMG
jgi:hypothetical protein